MLTDVTRHMAMNDHTQALVWGKGKQCPFIIIALTGRYSDEKGEAHHHVRIWVGLCVCVLSCFCNWS
jgi:hypothetical protein